MHSNPYTFTLMNKHAIKMIMVQVMQKSFTKQLSTEEYALLNVLKAILCQTGIFEYELNKVEQEFGGDSQNITSSQINEKFMVSNVNKVGN